MNSSIQIKINNKPPSGEATVQSGDKLEIQVSKDEQDGSSIIEVFDINQNRRFLSRRTGEHIFTTIIPKTKLFGKWVCKVSIHSNSDDSNEELQRTFYIKDTDQIEEITSDPDSVELRQDHDISGQSETIETVEVENHADTSDTDDETESKKYDNKEHGHKVEKNTETVEEDEIEENGTTNISDHDTAEDQTPHDKTGTVEVDEFEMVDEGLELTNMSNLSPDDRISTIKNITSLADLDLIIAIELDTDERNDLEIPIAEIDQVATQHQSELKTADILYIYHLLETNPREINRITTGTIEEIRLWLESAYKIYNNPEHGLRREYRKIRAEFAEYQRQLEKKMDSKKAQDPLSVLVGLNRQSIASLKEEGIETVGSLLQIPLLDLINLDVDPEKPLLPKLWIANAKSHVGIR